MSESLTQGVLTPFDYQKIGDSLGVELKELEISQSYTRQQIGVYSQIGEHIGDVVSEECYFTHAELYDKATKILDVWLDTFTRNPDVKKLALAEEEEDERNITPRTNTRRN